MHYTTGKFQLHIRSSRDHNDHEQCMLVLGLLDVPLSSRVNETAHRMKLI